MTVMELIEQLNMICYAKKFKSEGRQIANHYFPSYGTYQSTISLT